MAGRDCGRDTFRIDEFCIHRGAEPESGGRLPKRAKSLGQRESPFFTVPPRWGASRRQDMRAFRQNGEINKFLIQTLASLNSFPIHPVARWILRTGTPEPLVKLPRLKMANRHTQRWRTGNRGIKNENNHHAYCSHMRRGRVRCPSVS